MCDIKINITCFCGKDTKTVFCGHGDEHFSCGQLCDFKFKCGHDCLLPCHPASVHDENSVCKFDPTIVKFCPCGSASVDSLSLNASRKSCFDPIPTCSKICGKSLKCGHGCTYKCHYGDW